jgi:hypothetical protein
MKPAIATVAALAAAAPAGAQTITLKPLIETRLRGEHVEQDGLAKDADAVTLRVRAGVAVTRGSLSLVAEAQGNLAMVDHYYDGLNGAPARPLIGDPENIALHRAQLQYRDQELAVTVGRQRITLEDERFVGAVGFRQAGQTFDAVRVEWSGVPQLKADLTYAWGVRTIWGMDGTGARQQAISGDNVFANLSYASPIGTLTGFAYLVDQDEAPVQGFRLSSQSYGARLAGSRPISKGAKLGYQLSYARQGDLHRNPNRYRADYYLAEVSLDVAPFRIGGGYEVLGADRGIALTSFQTPAATLFKFNGWADKFLSTPPDGLRDLHASAGLTAKKVGPFSGAMLTATFHRFESDRLVRHYGNELDLLASGRLGRYTFSLRYADYRADKFATNTRKAWAQIDWTF